MEKQHIKHIIEIANELLEAHNVIGLLPFTTDQILHYFRLIPSFTEFYSIQKTSNITFEVSDKTTNDLYCLNCSFDLFGNVTALIISNNSHRLFD